MPRYQITAMPYYRAGVLYQPGAVVEFPEGKRAPKGARLVDQPAPVAVVTPEPPKAPAAVAAKPAEEPEKKSEEKPPEEPAKPQQEPPRFTHRSGRAADR